MLATLLFSHYLQQRKIAFCQTFAKNAAPLKGFKVEYYFTDLSIFFSNEAQGKLAEYDKVKYGIFDTNVDFTLQGYDASSFDLILYANVLYTSKNVHDVMEIFKGILTEEEIIFILEETRISRLLLKSMEFKDGLTGFTDERRGSNIITRAQRENVFDTHNGKIVYQFPAKESKLDLAGQTIYVVRFNNEYETISNDDEAPQIYLEQCLAKTWCERAWLQTDRKR